MKLKTEARYFKSGKIMDKKEAEREILKGWLKIFYVLVAIGFMFFLAWALK